MTVIRHVVFRGRVQGVGFRAFVEQQAMEFGVEGWVRNRRDGVSVEAVFAGVAETVATVIEACRKGPPHGRVDATGRDVRVGGLDFDTLRARVEIAGGNRFSALRHHGGRGCGLVQ